MISLTWFTGSARQVSNAAGFCLSRVGATHAEQTVQTAAQFHSMRARTHTHSYIDRHTHTHTQRGSHTHLHALWCRLWSVVISTHTHTRAHTHTQRHTHLHALWCRLWSVVISTRTHTHTHTHTQRETHTPACPLVRLCSVVRLDTHAHAHAHAHTHTHTHTRTHTETHTCMPSGAGCGLLFISTTPGGRFLVYHGCL